MEVGLMQTVDWTRGIIFSVISADVLHYITFVEE